MNRTYIPGSKTSVYYYKSAMFFTYICKNILHKTEHPKLLKDRFSLSPRALVFPRNHFLFDIFERKLQQYIEADLANYNLRFWDEQGNPKRFEVYKESFAVLTLSDLEAGFVVCLVPLAFSIFVFAIEWMQTLKDFVVVLIIFRKFFDIKKLEQSKHSELIKLKFAKWQTVKQNKDSGTLNPRTESPRDTKPPGLKALGTDNPHD